MEQKNSSGAPTPAVSIAPGLLGVVLFAIGGLLLENRNEDPDIFVTASFVFLGVGMYLILVGAVAHGIAIVRR